MNEKPDTEQTSTEDTLKAIRAEMVEVKRTLSAMTEVLGETNNILRLMAATKEKTYNIH